MILKDLAPVQSSLPDEMMAAKVAEQETEEELWAVGDLWDGFLDHLPKLPQHLDWGPAGDQGHYKVVPWPFLGTLGSYQASPGSGEASSSSSTSNIMVARAANMAMGPQRPPSPSDDKDAEMEDTLPSLQETSAYMEEAN